MSASATRHNGRTARAVSYMMVERAFILFRMGWRSKAADHFKKLREREPNDARPISGLISSTVRGSRAVEIPPTDAVRYE